MPPSEHEKEKIERLRRAMYSRTLAENLHEKARRELVAGESPVGEDWVDPKESIAGVTVAPRFIGATRMVLTWILGLAVVFFAAAVSFFVYFFVFGGGALPASPSNIDISVTGPPEVASGEPTELQIAITNRNNIDLDLADLVVTYPDGTRSPTDFSTDLPSTRIPLGTIEPGGKRQGTISAVFSGSTGSHADVKVELEYHLAGSNAVFVASNTYALSYKSSALSIAVDGNQETISGQPLQFTVKVTSNANAPLKDVLARVDVPFGFKLKSAAPAADSAGLWELGDFSPGETKQIVFTGTLNGEQGDARVFHITAGTRANGASSTIDTKLADGAYKLSISQPFLGLSVAVNKEASANAVVAPGDPVNVTVSYVNNLSTPITDAIIVAKLGGLQLDGTTVRSSDGFYRSSDGVVLWDKTTAKDKLEEIPAGGKGSVSFTFTAPSGDTLLGGSELDISVNAAGKRVGEDGVPQSLQAAAVQKVQVTSNVQLTAQGLYHSNPFGSSGPLPPQAQVETTYALVFTLTNTTSKITNAKMTAHLPPYVRWVGIYSPSSEKVSFNQLDGTVTWQLGTINPGVGVNGTDPRQAAIAVGFTPSTSQIGQSPALLQDIQLLGIDAGQAAAEDKQSGLVNTPQLKILASPKDITTNILGDPGFSPADAIVVRQQQ